MADTTTTNYGLTKPEVGASEDTWGTKLNTNLDTVDSKLDDIEGKSGAATLKYTDVAKLTTTATGADVTGTLTADGVTTDTLTTDALHIDSTGAVELPTGDISERPSGVTGMFRFNTETTSFEGYNGTAWSGVGGASGGAGNPFVYENDQTVTADYTITSDKNAMSTGPLTIDTGVTVTVPTGSRWVVI